MPRLVHMTWVASQHRWTKMYKGVRYYVSTRELGTLPTQADSILAANEWWERKRAEIDLARCPPQPGTAQAQAALLEAWKGEPVQSPQDAALVLLDLLAYFKDKPLPSEVQAALLGPERVAAIKAQAAAVLDTPAPPPGRTVGKLAEQWVKMQRQKVGAGSLSPANADNARIMLGHFRDWLGTLSSVDTITETKWLEWFNEVASKVEAKVWAAPHAVKVLATSKRFVRFCWEMRLIELPRNLDSPALSLRVPPKTVETWTNEELVKLFAVLDGQYRLHALLMLNCGFTARDISDLHPDEVDWTAGTITRRRSKTSNEPSTPVVRYKLWAQTFDLLQAWRSDDPDHVLVTAKGESWIEDKQGDQAYWRCDKVAIGLRRYITKAKVKHTPKALRATSASKLGEHPSYKFYIDYFLGHSPRSVTERHYHKPTDTEFFEALEWLETALGIAP